MRKGMGKGTGKGYKNMMGIDPKVHSQSAKGIKQPQSMKPIPKVPVLNSEEKEAMSNLGRDDFLNLKKTLKEEFDSKISNFREEENGVYAIELESGEEFYVFESDDRAERFAVEGVMDDLDKEPELFNKDFIQNHIYITDTYRRIMAGEESDNNVDNMDEEDIIKDSEYEDDYDELQETIDEKEIKESDLIVADRDVEADETREVIDKLEKEKEKLIDKAREDLRSSEYDKIYEALEDPIQYFVEEQGIYSTEELLNQSFISIDREEASEEAVKIDGWQHFVATYDGNSTEVDNTDLVLARTN